MVNGVGRSGTCQYIRYSASDNIQTAASAGGHQVSTRVSVIDIAHDYTGPLRAYFSRRCRNPADIDDLVQQVMLRILSCETTDDVRHIGAYVFKTAAHVLADQHRRSKARAVDAHVEFDADRHGDCDYDPSNIVEARQVLVLIDEALEQLPERSRTIFLQRRLENRPYRDIAAQFSISVSAVEKHMIRSASLMQQVRERSFCEVD